MKQFFYLMGIAAAAVALGKASETAAPLQVTPEMITNLAEEARTNNVGLKSAAARVQAAAENRRAVRTWEDPMGMVGGIAADRMMRSEEGDIAYGIEQQLPLFGRPKAAKRVAQAELEREKISEDYQFQLLRKEIALAVLDLALKDELLAISREDLVWLETMEAASEERYRAGTSSQVELLRMQTEKARRLDQITTETRARNDAAFALNRMMNRELNSSWPTLRLPELADPVPFSEQVFNLAVKFEPQLQLMQKEVRTAEAMIDMTRRERYPEVSLGVEGRQYSGTGDFREGMFLLRFNFPWVNADKYKADVRREQAKRDAAALEAADYELMVRREIHQLLTGIDAARREAILYGEQVIPRAEQALSSAQAAWQTNADMGADPFRDVLESRRMLLEGRQMRARAVAEQYRMIAEIVLCCGLGDLEAIQMVADPNFEPSNPSTKPQ